MKLDPLHETQEARHQPYQILPKDRLALRIGGTDLFHTRKEGGIGYTESMETQQISTYDSRQFVLTVTYKFNTSRSKYKGTGAGQAEKNRL